MPRIQQQHRRVHLVESKKKLHTAAYRGLLFYNVIRGVTADCFAEGSNAPHPAATSTSPSRSVEEVSSTPRPIENCEGFSLC